MLSMIQYLAASSTLVVAMLAGMVVGCGPGEGTTVIAPTEVYELTEQEQVNEKELRAARESDR